jgi:hypothetical protein
MDYVLGLQLLVAFENLAKERNSHFFLYKSLFIEDFFEVALVAKFGYYVGVIRGLENIEQLYEILTLQLFHYLDLVF